MLHKRAFYFLIVMTGILSILLVFLTYHAAFKTNVIKNRVPYSLYLDEDDNKDSLFAKLDTVLMHPDLFRKFCQVFSFDQVRTGRFIIGDGMDNFTLFKKLRNGQQDPVNVTFNNMRDIRGLCGALDVQLMLDSLSMLLMLQDSQWQQQMGIDSAQLLCLFIPNTYQIYWNISPQKLMERMMSEYQSFWSKNDRKAKADRKNLTPHQAYIVASIVEKETNLEDEKGLIAGVYLNRLKQGMKLQADPTVVYALGRYDVYRVLLEHLKVESPYNTYLVEGLPPGPIWMPSISTIDSVLDSPDHDYIFFCAKPGFEGRHAFSETMEGHSQNAYAYRKWLNQENIR